MNFQFLPGAIFDFLVHFKMTFLSELFVFDRKGSFCEKSDEDIFLENEIKTSMVDIAFQSQELIHNFFCGVQIVAKTKIFAIFGL